MSNPRAASPPDLADPAPVVGPGTILVNRWGQVKILRSRTSDGSGWNCADGAAIDDASATDPERWGAYTPEQLAAALALAEDVRQLSGQRELAGGLATWDACSGRPCVLPKLARVVKGVDRPSRSPADEWIAAAGAAGGGCSAGR